MSGQTSDKEIAWAAQRGRELKSSFLSHNETIAKRLQGGQDGRTLARELSHMRTMEVRNHFHEVSLHRATKLPGRVSVIVTGGLGRAEISTFSDLDIVLLCDHPNDEGVREFANSFFYPLWDGGVAVGNALRSLDDFFELLKQDITVLTAALDWRPVAGSKQLMREFSEGLNQTLGADAVKESMQHHLGGWWEGVNHSTAHMLEPNLKTGTGKLRTLHQVWWACRYLWRIGDWQDLLRRGLVDAFEVDTFQYGHQVLLETRLALHEAAGRGVDVLSAERQNAVAEALGIVGHPREPAADLLLKSVYRCAKAIRAAADRMLEVCQESMARRLGQVDYGLASQSDLSRFVSGRLIFGRLAFSPGGSEGLTSTSILRLLRETQIQRCGLHWSARAQIQETVPRVFTAAACQNPANIDLFMDLITHTGTQGDDLERLHEFGILERMFPAFGRVTGLVQRDLYHVYTVDAHLIHTARRTLRLLEGSSEEDAPDFQAIAARVIRQHVLVVAALFHDIGKGQGHGHAARGAALARQAAVAFGWSSDDAEDLVFLVDQHLAMMIISQRRDMEDMVLIEKFAHQVESIERLDMLMALSYVDAISTGPEAFTDWKAALLRELYLRTKQALRAGVGDLGVQDRKRIRINELCQESCKGDGFRAFLERMSARHVLSHHRSLLLAHQVTLQAAETDGAAVRIHGNRKRARWEIVVACLDRPGLAADNTAVFAEFGIRIIGAHMAVSQDGYSLDTFIAEATHWHQLEQPPFRERLREALQAAARGDSAKRRPTFSPRSRLFRESRKPRVIFDPDASERATVLDVLAENRPGLMHDLAQAVFDSGASIKSARMTTEGRRAIHAFYVVDAKSDNPLGAPARESLQELIIERLSPKKD